MTVSSLKRNNIKEIMDDTLFIINDEMTDDNILVMDEEVKDIDTQNTSGCNVGTSYSTIMLLLPLLLLTLKK
ncbi:hypothetical protein EOM09_01695 [bacterium]|nr:hypothetical protein [bacterium]